MDFLWFVLIGLTAGWLAGQILGAGDHGPVGAIALISGLRVLRRL